MPVNPNQMAEAKVAVYGRDFYETLYRTDKEAEAAWLRLGAADKVDTIEALLASGGPIHSILELGCGTGAVIEECVRRKLASEFAAVDYSEHAIDYLRARVGGVTAIVADIMAADQPALKRHFDVIVLSHVLEHLERPQFLLRRIREQFQFSYLIVEVPLEGLPLARLKMFMRNSTHLAGHVQFFRRETIRKLILDCDLGIVSDRLYVPRVTSEMIDFQNSKDRVSSARSAARHLTGRYLPRVLGPVYARSYYAHYGLLCVSANSRRQEKVREST